MKRRRATPRRSTMKSPAIRSRSKSRGIGACRRWCSKASPFSGRTGSRWRSGAWNKRDCVRARVCTQLPRDRGLKQNGSVRGEKAQEYVDISRLLDEAMGHFDQIPPLAQLGGRPNGFHIGPKAACKGKDRKSVV